jgi:hypothetical protein
MIIKSSIYVGLCITPHHEITLYKKFIYVKGFAITIKSQKFLFVQTSFEFRQILK